MFKRTDTRGAKLQFTFNDHEVTGQTGDTIATALLASGHLVFGSNPSSGEDRGPFCLMGSCFECMVEVDGVSVQACQAILSEGLDVRSLTSPALFSGETS